MAPKQNAVQKKKGALKKRGGRLKKKKTRPPERKAPTRKKEGQKTGLQILTFV